MESVARRVLQFAAPPNERGCRMWLGTKRGGRSVYGQIKINGRARGVHRVAWELVHGPIPDGLCVCHTCDEPICVNVGHMFLGTHRENMADRQAKGRTARGAKSGARTHPETHARGERSGRAKLRAADVIEIRRRYANGTIIADMRREYGVDWKTIQRAIHGGWRDLTPRPQYGPAPPQAAGIGLPGERPGNASE